jgi:hypothetical protein
VNYLTLPAILRFSAVSHSISIRIRSPAFVGQGEAAPLDPTGSDIGHFDLPDMLQPVPEAYELVEDGLISPPTRFAHGARKTPISSKAPASPDKPPQSSPKRTPPPTPPPNNPRQTQGCLRTALCLF